ncbi:hypothetical protein SCG7109_BD_00060, partial [Chlamydiales bacterium SCGC AG-110-M15]
MGASAAISLILGIVLFLYFEGIMRNEALNHQKNLFFNTRATFQELTLNSFKRDLADIVNSPLFDDYLLASKVEQVLFRQKILQLFLRKSHKKYDFISFIDPKGSAEMTIQNESRHPAFQLDVAKPHNSSSFHAHLLSLLTTLSKSSFKELWVEGPYKDEEDNQYLLAGLAKRDLDTGLFAGALIIKWPLSEFYDYLGSLELSQDDTFLVYSPSGELLNGRSSRTSIKKVSSDWSNYANKPVYHDPFVIQHEKELFVIQDLLWVNQQKPLLRLVSMKADFFQNERNHVFTIVFLLLISSMLLAFLLSFFLSKHLTQPISILSKALEKVGKGELSQRIQEISHAEFQTLFASFNSMAECLEKSTVTKEFLDSIFTNISSCIIVCDKDYKIQYVNPAICKLLSRSKEDLIGDRLVSLFEGNDFDFINDLDKDLKDCHPPYHEARSFCDASGNKISVSFSAIAFEDRNKKPSLLCVAEDIRHQKRAEDAMLKAKYLAEKASQEKSTFLAKMSHELRTPLNAIIGFTQILDARLKSENISDKSLKNFKHIQSSSKHLLSLVNNILDLSAIESGKLDLELSEFNLQKFLDDIYTTYSGYAEIEGLAINKSFEKTLPRKIISDPTKINQVLVNLLSNAIKYSNPGDSILLKVSQNDMTLNFTVKDTGKGIPKNDLKNIFDSYVKGEVPRLQIEGTGLGLNIVKSLV